MTGSVAGRDFFISFAGSNRSWAEWIAVELERVGYKTVVQTFDFRPGTDFVHLMQEAASTCDRTIALLSPAYLTSSLGESEWRCTCREMRPSSSGGTLVLPQDAAETVVSAHGQPGEAVRVGDWFGQRCQRSCVGDALVGTVLVIEGLEFAERVQQMPLVPDRRAVQQLAATGPHPVGADNLIRAAQAACSYSWRSPPSRSWRRMCRCVIVAGPVIGSGSARRGRAFAMPR